MLFGTALAAALLACQDPAAPAASRPPPGPTRTTPGPRTCTFLEGKRYIDFTAGPGPRCGGQRLWVLGNAGPAPKAGTRTEEGQLAVPGQDRWALDATVLKQRGQRYPPWSGQEAGLDQQNLCSCRLRNP